MFHRARLRLTGVFVLFLFAILIGFDAGVIALTGSGLRNNVSDDLMGRAHQAAAALVNVGGVTYFDQHALSSDSGWSDVALYITTPTGRVDQEASSVGRSVLPQESAVTSAMVGRAGLIQVGGDRDGYLVYTQPVYRKSSAFGGDVVAVVQVARSLRTVSGAMERLSSLLVGSTVLALLVTFVTGFWLAGQTLDPIRVSLEGQKQFVGDASHELRTPLTVIRTAAESILRQRETISPRVRGLAEDIVAETAQLGRLAEDLSVLAHLESRRQRARRDPVQVSTLFKEVAASSAHLAEAGGVRLESSISGDGVILGDAGRLRQLMGILLDNAIKFSPRDSLVSLVGQVVGKRVVFRVVDRGPGIPEADLPRIFERFFRGSDERRREGTGLGLAIARALVDEHRGSISVRSVVGQGTEFVVELPLQESVQVAETAID
ncbi:MAG: sensor histidine kinase [Candidatus Dormibacteria bacterium]